MDETIDPLNNYIDNRRKFRGRSLEPAGSSGMFSLDGPSEETDQPVEEQPKKYHDKRLDSVTRKFDMYAHQGSLNVLRTATGLGLDHLNTGDNRFKAHAMESGTGVTSSSQTGLVQGKKSLLDGSLRNVSTIRRRPQDMRSGFEKRMEKLRQQYMKHK
jgi:hypothetical protein